MAPGRPRSLRAYRQDVAEKPGKCPARAGAGGASFAVHVVPRSSVNEVSGYHGDAIKIKLVAPAVDGAANQALLEFLSKKLGVAKRHVMIIAGEHSRDKLVRVEGIGADDVERLLPSGEESRRHVRPDPRSICRKTNKVEE